MYYLWLCTLYIGEKKNPKYFEIRPLVIAWVEFLKLICANIKKKPINLEYSGYIYDHF